MLDNYFLYRFPGGNRRKRRAMNIVNRLRSKRGHRTKRELPYPYNDYFYPESELLSYPEGTASYSHYIYKYLCDNSSILHHSILVSLLSIFNLNGDITYIQAIPWFLGCSIWGKFSSISNHEYVRTFVVISTSIVHKLSGGGSGGRGSYHLYLDQVKSTHFSWNTTSPIYVETFCESYLCVMRILMRVR